MRMKSNSRPIVFGFTLSCLLSIAIQNSRIASDLVTLLVTCWSSIGLVARPVTTYLTTRFLKVVSKTYESSGGCPLSPCKKMFGSIVSGVPSLTTLSPLSPVPLVAPQAAKRLIDVTITSMHKITW